MSGIGLPSCQEPLVSCIVIKPLNEKNIDDVPPIVINSWDDIYYQITRLKATNIFGWAAFLQEHPNPKWYAVDEGFGNIRLMFGDKEAFLQEYEPATQARSGQGENKVTSGQDLEAVASPSSDPPGIPNKISLEEFRRVWR